MEDEDSIDAIDRDLKEAVQFCLSSGLSSKQIAKDAVPLLSMSASSHHTDSASYRSRAKFILGLAVVVAVFAFLLQNTWTFKWMCIAGKTLEVKILPYWDWTKLYREECLVPNPYIVVANLTEEDCELCENYHAMDIVHDMKVDEVTDHYLFENIPFIVTDAVQSWRAFEEFNYESLKKIYTSNEILRSSNVCDYSGEHKLADILSSTKYNFHAFWVNCKLPAVKVFRGYYHRPYFLPPMVESVLENFVAFSSGGLTASSKTKEEDEFRECFSNGDMIWFAQIRGHYRIQLRPQPPCDKICKMLEVVLQEGQTVVLTTEMWELWFAPVDDQPAIAIGSSGNWDS